jgi:hypothetical protein
MSEPVPNPPDVAAEEWRRKVAGTLINAETLLATDYLNHFNEVVMLVEMVPDMPDMLAECQAWKLISYPEHLSGANLDYGALAAEAYDHVPPATKGPFEQTVAQLARTIDITLKRLEEAFMLQSADQARAVAKAGTTTMHALIERAGGIINGAQESLAQADIDRMLAAGNDPAPAPPAQSDIDKLFG